jgi:hypothetical protein
MESSTREYTLAAETFQESPDLRIEAESLPRTKELRERTHTAEVDGQTLHVVEGDLLLDEDELALHALRQEALRNAEKVGATPSGLGATTFHAASLVAVAPSGQIVRWRPGKTLNYCVLRATFPGDQQYQRVCDDLVEATTAWQDTCGVEFSHLAQHDSHPDPTSEPGAIAPELVFTVRYIDAQGQFIASAFFPTYPPKRRRVLVDPSFYAANMGFDTVGVFRHELGHVLGFRHEHIRSGAPAVCPDEPTFDTKNLTDYDPQSVMHYFCGEVGSTDLAITELDRIGAQSVYGPAFGSLMLVE